MSVRLNDLNNSLRTSNVKGKNNLACCQRKDSSVEFIAKILFGAKLCTQKI